MNLRFVQRSCAVVAIALAGCATSYKPDGVAGGYSDTRLDENVFRVSFSGNGYTSRDRAEDMAILRASELTLQHGYKYFVIGDARSSTKDSLVSMPMSSNTTFSGSTYGNTTTGTARTTYSGGQLIAISSPQVSFTITCFTEKPEGTKPPINAELARQGLVAKYGLKLTTPQ